MTSGSPALGRWRGRIGRVYERPVRDVSGLCHNKTTSGFSRASWIARYARCGRLNWVRCHAVNNNIGAHRDLASTRLPAPIGQKVEPVALGQKLTGDTGGGCSPVSRDAKPSATARRNASASGSSCSGSGVGCDMSRKMRPAWAGCKKNEALAMACISTITQAKAHCGMRSLPSQSVRYSVPARPSRSAKVAGKRSYRRMTHLTTSGIGVALIYGG
jgi:hypothetical protein